MVVEWWRLVHALEKSKPRDLRGSTDPGEPYVVEESSFGDKGTRFTNFAVLVLLMSRGGICRLKPRAGKSGLLGVTGLGAKQVSSFEVFLGSWKDGDGESTGAISFADHARGLDEDGEWTAGKFKTACSLLAAFTMPHERTFSSCSASGLPNDGCDDLSTAWSSAMVEKACTTLHLVSGLVLLSLRL